MEAPRQTRAVHRALDVLEFLAQNGPAELHSLHKGTGLSKSTLRRLLATLAQRRFVRMGLSDGLYRSNVAAPNSARAELIVRIGELVEAARPHMLDLTQDTRWPVDLHIYATGRMRILESTHGLSPFPSSNVLKPDTELNVFAAASGLAYLAALTDDDVVALVETLRNDDFSSPARFGLSTPRLLADLAAIRQAGFAARRLAQATPGDRHAIAVAIHDGGQPIGALVISWKRQLMSAAEFAAIHLERLSRAAAAISSSLPGGARDKPEPPAYAPRFP